MDESIKVYTPKKWRDIEEQLNEWNEIMVDQPRKSEKKIHVSEIIHQKKDPEPKKESRSETLEHVFVEHEAKIHELEEKHSWVPVFYKRLFVGLAILLLLSFVQWGIVSYGNYKASTAYDQGVNDKQAEQTAKEEAAEKQKKDEENAIENRKARDIDMMSHFIAGIQNFVENKGYTDVDLETYGQCPINRVLNTSDFAKITNLEEAFSQENQWVGYSLLNNPTIKHRQIAEKLVNRLYNKEPMPCSESYCWTEFTEKGLWLKSDYGPAAFNNTWRAG